MKRVVLLVVLAVLVVSATGLASGNPSNPYWQRKLPDYYGIVSAFAATEPAGFRKTSIDQLDLKLLELWFSDSAMYMIYKALPITSWKQLHDIRYVSISSSSGKDRAACSETKALQLMILFDLKFELNDKGEKVWPWAM